MMISRASARERSAMSPLVVALTPVLGLYLCIQVIAFSKIGAFEFPLDDIYIHLAMAEQIASGGYGVNAGEYTSAASSPLYPFLLVPFGGQPAQIWVAVLWNLLALVGSVVLWVRIVGDAVEDRRWAAVLAALGPLAFNLAGAAMVAMEHTLHVFASLAVLRGLQTQMREGRISWLLVFGMLIGPLIRFEGLAVSGAAASALALVGRWKIGAGLFAISVALVAAFMGFLMSLGLEPLPNSVMAKISGPTGSPDFALANLFGKLQVQLQRSVPAMAMLVTLVIALVSLVRSDKADSMGRAILVAALFAGSGQLFLGQFGWFERYELYAMSFVFGLMMLYAFRPEVERTVRVLVVVGLGFLTIYYGHWMLRYGVWAPGGIYAQQQNASRFVKDVYQKPIAVNDLGYVAWGNPNYVLDLWGLASYRALKIRMDEPYEGWAGDLTDEAGIDLAIVYDSWFEDGLGKDWVKVGTLRFTNAIAFLGGRDVSYYATNAEAAPELRQMIADFAPTVTGPAEMWVEEGTVK
ncbi:hypothetical protein J3R80_10445 [Aliiroseovarius sp. Z3]|uniref:hypothetical protein n=1 Tax=Aliiroseovarius sp. Z3 TaxID=2811402 RepID=UPI0023B26E68|nr:hypothetical protein [Aliiroseovarius sp. Z3]MDE9450884.1 hypothetical protein [Aliiroseovarius sp. Z3]